MRLIFLYYYLYVQMGEIRKIEFVKLRQGDFPELAAAGNYEIVLAEVRNKS